MNAFSRFFVFALVALSAASSVAAVSPAEVGWEEISNDDGITCYRKEVEGSPVVAFRGVSVVDAPIAKVANVLYDTTRKLEWVARIKEARNVREFSPLERIEYNHTGAPWPIKDRDFVFKATVVPNKAAQTITFNLNSVEDASAPETDDYVRGELKSSKYVLTSVEGGKKTQVEVEIHADPRGSVPKWVVNLFQKSWPRKTLEGIQAQAARPDVVENAYYKSLLE